jgi:O-antigen ligase
VQSITAAQRSSRTGFVGIVGLIVLGALVAVGNVVAGPLAILPIFGVLFFVLILVHPEYGIALFLSTFLMTYPASLQGTGFLTINNAMGGIFLILLTYKVYQDQDWWFLRAPEMQLLVFILLMFYLSDRFNGPDPRLLPLLGVVEHGSENMRTFVTRTAFILFFINFIRAPRHVLLIYLEAVVLMVISAITGVQDVMHGGGLYGYRAVAGSVIAAAANPNRLAMFAILAIAELYFLTTWVTIPGIVVLVSPLVGVLALCVFMTASRSGLLGLGVCGISIIVEEGFSLQKLFSYGLTAALVTILVLQFVPGKTLDRITNLPLTQGGTSGLGSTSIERREYNWEQALEMFRQNPFLGVGIGNWELARFLQDPTHETGAPHSSYLLALCEGGIFCLSGYLLLMWRTWRNIAFAERYMDDPNFPLSKNLKWVVKSTKTDFIVLVFFSIFADLWQLVIIFWLVGISIVLRRMVEQVLVEQELTPQQVAL